MSDDDKNTQYDDGLAVAEAKPEVKKPPLYHVVLLNDDYTPMEFVVHVLEHFFNMQREAATRVMLQVHTQGKGVCGTFTREIAEQKLLMSTIIRVTTTTRCCAQWSTLDTQRQLPWR